MAVTTSSLERILAAMPISDRLWVKSIYESVAEVIKADGIVSEPEIKEAADVVRIHESVKRFVSSGMHGTYPGLMKAIDKEVHQALSESTGGINRTRIVTAFDKIAWSGLGGDE